ncbi:TOTE conflict system archaeo-eukaryotic primase domain-containing protein [Thiococcus pfennigii]|uniref:TOTE conflict system archaeo-eukaryotic primase domain-containing protein n=1 Tax=Thiococcus pfennigii TaxID=1057 RepID=UPI003B848D7A|nr:hypothetical protein [Thiococcus pfennigii]
MGCFLLTETMARRHELPMTSYDRLFPNQDTMPRGGFADLIVSMAKQSDGLMFTKIEGRPDPGW